MDSTSFKKLLVKRFSTTDYAVFGAMLAISAVIGVYFGIMGMKKNTTKEFLMGGRSLKVLPVSLSVLASFMSAITLLGTPAEIYTYGTQYWMIILAYIILIPAAVYLYLPTFYKLELTSAYEYLERRFNRRVRTLGSMTFAIQTILYMAVVLYAPALALAQVTGLSVWSSVASIAAVCTFYTTIGGIKAVVMTDAFQVIMMFISMFVIVFKGAEDIGGWQKVWEINQRGGRIEFFNFDFNPTTRHTTWALVIGGYFTWLAIYGINQSMVQRYLSIPTFKGAQKVIWINLPGLSLLLTLTSMAGLVIYAKYHDCDPQKSNLIEAPDQLFPLFVMDTLGSLPGLPGLFVAGIFSGALSTLSSGMNSLAAVALEDVIKPYIKPDISEIWATRLSKILAFFFGILATVLVIIAEQLGNVLQVALSLFGMLGGPLLGLFSLGMFFPWANATGATFGLLGGLIVSFWVGFGAFIHKPKYPKLVTSIDGCLDGVDTLFSFITAENSTGLYDNTTTLYSTALGSNNTNIYPTILDFNTTAAVIQPDTDPLIGFYSISYMWYSALGCITAVFLGLLISCYTGLSRPRDIDSRLICPAFEVITSCLPIGIRHKLTLNKGDNVDKKEDVKSVKILLNTDLTNNTKCEKIPEYYVNGAYEPEKFVTRDENGTCTKF